MLTGETKDFRSKDLSFFNFNPDVEAVKTKDGKTIYYNVFFLRTNYELKQRRKI